MEKLDKSYNKKIAKNNNPRTKNNQQKLDNKKKEFS